MPNIRHLAPVLAMLLAILAWAPALGADIPRLDGPVTDRTGVLRGSTGAIGVALDDLLQEHDIQLFVVFVPTTAELTVTGFADETARVNSLGGNDALLFVALSDRTDAIWVADSLSRITDAEIDAVLSDVLEPGLRSGAYGAAVAAAALALGAASDATAPTGTPTASPSQGGTGSGGINLGALFGALIVLAGGFLVARWLLARQALLRETGERDRRTAKLAREANTLLIATDERVRSADEEAGFVEAEFGEPEAVPFRAAIVEAREELAAAFAVRQRLDDGEPEDPPTREAMLSEITQRLQRAGAALDRQTARIRELRDLEREAPTILAGLPARADAVEARLPAAESSLRTLTSYAEPSWAAVKGNLEEARKGLVGARAAIMRGRDALARGESQTAAREIRVAQEGTAGGAALLDAVERLAATAGELAGGLAGQLGSAAQDLDGARAALAGLDAGLDVPGAVDHGAGLAEAEAAWRAAQAAASARPLDPIAAHHLAMAAHTKSSDLLSALRLDAEQQARFAAALEGALDAARKAVDCAADFIATRRSGIGREARTRLAEAERWLASAEAGRSTDPKAAMEQAGRAHELAAQAYALAGTDFDRWDQGGPRPTGTGGGSDVAGAILGGIIGGILSGGGNRGAGWGGSSWGASRPSGGGGGWGGGGRSRGGSFGGGGGGGGRSRGGRW